MDIYDKIEELKKKRRLAHEERNALADAILSVCKGKTLSVVYDALEMARKKISDRVTL